MEQMDTAQRPEDRPADQGVSQNLHDLPIEKPGNVPSDGDPDPPADGGG